MRPIKQGSLLRGNTCGALRLSSDGPISDTKQGIVKEPRSLGESDRGIEGSFLPREGGECHARYVGRGTLRQRTLREGNEFWRSTVGGFVELALNNELNRD